MDSKQLLHYIKGRYTDRKYPFRDRLYFLFGSAGFISAAAAFVAAIFSGLPAAAAIASAASFFVMLGLMILSFCLEDITVPRIVCALFLNLFMFPALFWMTGGIDCGMIYYFILGLCVCALILEGNLRIVVLTISLASYLLHLQLGFAHPEWASLLSYEERWADTLASFAIVSVFVAAVIIIMAIEYQSEHDKVLQIAARLREQSITDSLTGLHNSRFLLSELEALQQQRQTQNRPAALLMLDIDDFKHINDNYGHRRGDQVLARFALLMQEMAQQQGCTAARYGGEEFVVILPDRSPAQGHAFAEALRVMVSTDPLLSELAGRPFSVSGGVAECLPDETPYDWIGRADERMYTAKHRGKNQIVS